MSRSLMPYLQLWQHEIAGPELCFCRGPDQTLPSAISIPSEYRPNPLLKTIARMPFPFTLLTRKQFNQLQQARLSYQSLVEQTQQATHFIRQIEEGNLESALLAQSDEQARSQEKNAIVTALLSMRERMQHIARQEAERNWTSEGLARFTEILRDKHTYAGGLFDAILSQLVKYVGANQGSLFVVANQGETTLEMVSCYAYERKKYRSRTIMPGEGLVGQCYLEGESIFITQVPENYVQITSGLGLATPQALMLVPLKLNDQVTGVVELASFHVFAPHQIRFVEKLGESIAATIADTQVSEHTRQLMEQMRHQTEELKAQEEEMRQSLEELAATQEEVRRRETEAQNMLLAFRTVSDTYASIEFDMKGNVIVANDNFLKTMGYSLEEIKGRHHSLFVDAQYARTDDYVRFWEDLQAGQAFTGEVMRVSKSKAAVWMQVSYAPVRDSAGRYYKVVKLATDVSAQKELEKAAQQQLEELKAQEEELRQNMEELAASQEEISRQSVELQGLSAAVNTTLATIEFTPEGKILGANENFLKLMGYPLTGITGRHHSLFVEPEYGRSPAYADFWKALQQGHPQVGEVKRLTRQGEEKWLSASYTPVLDSQQQVVKVIKFAQDITDRKRLELDGQSQLTAIDRAFAVIEFTPEGSILSANENFLNLMGYSLDQVQGKHHRMFVRAEEASSDAYAQFWQTLRAGQFVSGEFERIGADGRTVRIKGSYSPIADLNGRVYKVVKYAQQLG